MNTKKIMAKGKPRAEKAASANEPIHQTPGIIADIAMVIEKAGEKGLSKDEILAELVKKFPERDPEAMRKTIATEEPDRITIEKLMVEKTPEGKYRKT